MYFRMSDFSQKTNVCMIIDHIFHLPYLFSVFEIKNCMKRDTFCGTSMLLDFKAFNVLRNASFLIKFLNDKSSRDYFPKIDR